VHSSTTTTTKTGRACALCATPELEPGELASIDVQPTGAMLVCDDCHDTLETCEGCDARGLPGDFTGYAGKHLCDECQEDLEFEPLTPDQARRLADRLHAEDLDDREEENA
jgi:hypothetical protein